MSEDRNAPLKEVAAPTDARFAIVWSRFNREVVGKLLEGAQACLAERGVSEKSVYVVEVPGAWELPYAAQQLAQSKRFDAVVALGAVIRGGTPHFDFVSQGTALGLGRVALDTKVPVIFGLLTTDDEAQAFERAGGTHGNKGRDAALTAIEMVILDRKLADDGITTKRA
ncbi:MAG: 6,7-dimethyl-8-ribityllumazine synthase [Deltaproteobacteria bacterium]|nr:6,7-dimethyl-8-ribityllumazine synthase [Deltaproteobacteria bacterium]NND28519.1 6,7-dimethyl-8-ribityllumazine synthase [Myxococcales bacterium]MBT8463045.1 6,7-dimethyl-8-ribityllumazine synthase [Deltaproteobacteria bacterium]MBT8483658.1 6,7-dimethyl-8-ribityllumazine synthase [Deltaproteobacteria bacterium]NNK08611.1 6,7-dimethyl-8-ribityllumazine synthase [Myxococcales bacterium]